MKHISSHLERERKKDKATERGELMRYFMQKLNVTRTRDGLPPLSMARMGRVLQGIPTRDLYFLKSVCDDALNRSGPVAFSKKFWWEVNPKKHTEEAKRAQEQQFAAAKAKGRGRRNTTTAGEDYA